MDGDNVVVKLVFVCHDGPIEGKPIISKVYLNETQCFDNVPEVAWNFYMCGNQSAQKWLKHRKGRTLESDDILQYKKNN